MDALTSVVVSINPPKERSRSVVVAAPDCFRPPPRHEENGSGVAGRRAKLGERGYAKLKELIADVFAEGAATDELRGDVAPAELASFCVHAPGAAGSTPSRAAVRRLVVVTLAALRRPKR